MVWRDKRVVIAVKSSYNTRSYSQSALLLSQFGSVLSSMETTVAVNVANLSSGLSRLTTSHSSLQSVSPFTVEIIRYSDCKILFKYQILTLYYIFVRQLLLLET